MQGDLPQGDPRLQKSDIGPRVTTSHVDPCIVYLEATEAGEVPILFACWARSSHDIREVDGTRRLQLAEVIVMTSRPLRNLGRWSMRDGKTPWLFSARGPLSEVVFTNDASGWKVKGLSYSKFFPHKEAYGFQGSLKYLDAQSDQMLHQLHTGSTSAKTSPVFAQKMLSLATVEWPSLINALAFCNVASDSRKRRPTSSLWRRLTSSLLGQKLAKV